MLVTYDRTRGDTIGLHLRAPKKLTDRLLNLLHRTDHRQTNEKKGKNEVINSAKKAVKYRHQTLLMIFSAYLAEHYIHYP